MIKTLAHIAFVATLCLSPALAQAACYADYKASKDNPLRLHYGVARISGPCTAADAQEQLRARLASKGWTLQRVLSVFDESGLSERKGSAGNFYLRY